MLEASILVVEDERIVALDLSHRLVELGYRVVRTVARGEDALRAVETLRPDLVLMDINIEGSIDGIDAATRIHETSRTPVVFMTAYAEDETLARAQACRPYGYLIKPYETRELHATIQVALARHESDAAVERSEERLRLAMDAADLAVWEWDAASDRVVVARRPAPRHETQGGARAGPGALGVAPAAAPHDSGRSWGVPVAAPDTGGSVAARARRGASPSADAGRSAAAASTATASGAGSSPATTPASDAERAATTPGAEPGRRPASPDLPDRASDRPHSAHVPSAGPRDRLLPTPGAAHSSGLARLLEGIDPADCEAIRDALNRGETVNGIWPLPTGPAAGHWIELHAKPVRRVRAGDRQHGPATPRVVGVLRDVTVRRRAEERLRQAGIVFDRIADAIVMADAQRRIVSVNPAFVTLTGWSPADAIGQDIDALLHEPPHAAAFWPALAETADGHWRGEVCLRRRDGQLLTALQTISLVPAGEDDSVRYVITCSDLTSMREAQEQLSYLAHHDVLTGLPNRALLDERLDHELQRARRMGQGLALLFIDLDGFKTINDSLGHAAGDQLLQAVGRRLRASIRDVDTAARLGGDEFVVVMTDLGHPEDASVLATKLLSLLAEPVEVEGRAVTVSASIGVAVYPQDGTDRGALMMASDSAMYAAKAHGRNHVSFYTRALASRARRRLDVEQGLRRALERGEMGLNFQPVVALADRRLVAAEALLRWHRADGVAVAPEQFVPIAEDSGLIEALGLFVLERACDQAIAWRAAGLHLPTVCVNVSPRQLERGDFASHLKGILQRSGLPPDQLEIELTETALRVGEAPLNQLETIRALGVQIAIDDFGTGYSSLSALQHLPISRLKIDRSFVHGLGSDPSALAIVETIVAMSRTLGLRVTAEGIETDTQLEALQRLGCEAGQGFLLGMPVDAAAFESQLRAPAGGLPSPAPHPGNRWRAGPRV
jgi:diguanylate cyclase (GGDEF)-like protein/PAS domain S-box-containing protein